MCTNAPRELIIHFSSQSNLGSIITSLALLENLHDHVATATHNEWKLLSRVQLFATPQTAAWQALLSMGFSRQQYWSGLPFASPGDLPNPGIKPRSSALQVGFFSTWATSCKEVLPLLCLSCFLGWNTQVSPSLETMFVKSDICRSQQFKKQQNWW